jgi:hypothetical protein
MATDLYFVGQNRDTLSLQENIMIGQRIERFVLEYKMGIAGSFWRKEAPWAIKDCYGSGK